MIDRLTLLTFVCRLSGSISCALSRAVIAEAARRGLVVLGWSADGRLMTTEALPDRLTRTDWGTQRRAEA